MSIPINFSFFPTYVNLFSFFLFSSPFLCKFCSRKKWKTHWRTGKRHFFLPKKIFTLALLLLLIFFTLEGHEWCFRCPKRTSQVTALHEEKLQKSHNLYHRKWYVKVELSIKVFLCDNLNLIFLFSLQKCKLII